MTKELTMTEEQVKELEEIKYALQLLMLRNIDGIAERKITLIINHKEYQLSSAEAQDYIIDLLDDLIVDNKN